MGQGVASTFSMLLLSVSDSQIIVLTLVMLILVIAGSFLDGNSIIYICTPLFLPVVTSFGLSPMWLGIAMTSAVLVGLITPPVAASIYPAAKIADINLIVISKSIVWFVALGIIGCYILLYFPEISLWLPRIMGYNVG